MSVRKHRNKWLCTITTPDGKKSYKTFKLRKDAVDFDADNRVKIKKGTFISERESCTVAEAAELWLASCNERGLERATTDRYRQHIDLNITPYIGALKLPKLTLPVLRVWQDRLRSDGKTQATVKGATVALSSILAEAMARGLAAQNVLRAMPRRKSTKQRRKLEIGRDVPSISEVQALLLALNGSKWRPLIMTAIFSGMRASELRGIRWQDVDLQNGVLHVKQRIDNRNNVGAPKSASGTRTIPMLDILINVLREHKLASKFTKSPDLVFCNGSGNAENLGNIVNRGLHPAWVAARVVNESGKSKYTGMHVLRHFFASWMISPSSSGGLNISLKEAQTRLGHSSIMMTADVYGHLMPRLGTDRASNETATRLFST